jgi:hypothetical protein
MTTKSPLIRRLGNGYCASGDGFYFHDTDLARLLERVARLSTELGESGRERARDEGREQDRPARPSERAAAE